jgi:hypothetical protein
MSVRDLRTTLESLATCVQGAATSLEGEGTSGMSPQRAFSTGFSIAQAIASTATSVRSVIFSCRGDAALEVAGALRGMLAVLFMPIRAEDEPSAVLRRQAQSLAALATTLAELEAILRDEALSQGPGVGASVTEEGLRGLLAERPDESDLGTAG